MNKYNLERFLPTIDYLKTKISNFHITGSLSCLAYGLDLKREPHDLDIVVRHKSLINSLYFGNLLELKESYDYLGEENDIVVNLSLPSLPLRGVEAVEEMARKSLQKYGDLKMVYFTHNEIIVNIFFEEEVNENEYLSSDFLNKGSGQMLKFYHPKYSFREKEKFLTQYRDKVDGDLSKLTESQKNTFYKHFNDLALYYLWKSQTK